MVTFGKCPYCKETDLGKNDHHIIPQRYTRKKRPRKYRLDIPFPEFFRNGEKNMTESICFACHSLVHQMIPSVMLTPDKYILIHKRMLVGEELDKPTIKRWVEESRSEIKRRQERFSKI